MKKKILLSLILILSSAIMSAQNIRVTAPSHVACGENFQVAYTLNTHDIDDFRLGNIPEGIQLVAGPYKSTQSSIQMINGHTSSSSSTKITYTLYAEKNGTYTIPAARAIINGKNITSAPVKITISGQGSPTIGVPKMHDNSSNAHIATGNELFIRVSASKSKVYEQEPILLTYKVYTTQELTQLEGKMPDLKGFHTQEIPLPQQKSFHLESVNGKQYKTVTWSQYVMFPQMTGELEIPSITFKGTVVVENKSVDPLEAFLNGGSNYKEIPKTIVAPSIKVSVLPLPKRPENFSGGVGQFTISTEADRQSMQTGEALTYRIKINGTGNMKLLKQPNPLLPTSFETYDPKVSDKTTLVGNSIAGSIIYDFVAVPTTPGKYVIPKQPFCFFDTATKQYRTIYADSIVINVSKGKGSQSSQSNYQLKDRDIHPLKIGEAKSHSNGFWGTTKHICSLLFASLMFIILLLVFRKRAANRADAVRARNKKATRIASQRLKRASKLMNLNKVNDFYDEVLRALWQYVSFKLDISTENLSRENIVDKLQTSDIDQNTIDLFVRTIDECEYMRYAPGDALGNMQQTFKNAQDAIVRVESTIKKMKRNRNSKATTLLFLCLLFSQICTATTKAEADKEYNQGNYQASIEVYTQLLKSNPSPDLYYNLGNAYYRMNNYPFAILMYERALRLAPADNDILFNLQLSKSKTIDKIHSSHQVLVKRWYLGLVHLFSVDIWAVIGIVALVIASLLLLLYLFAEQLLLRKFGFYGALCGLTIFILSHLLAFQQVRMSKSDVAGIIMQTTQIYKSASQTSEKLSVMHEGTKAIIIDNSIKGWLEVRFEDGNTGWMENKNIEII